MFLLLIAVLFAMLAGLTWLTDDLRIRYNHLPIDSTFWERLFLACAALCGMGACIYFLVTLP